jgi:hypothetical protein
MGRRVMNLDVILDGIAFNVDFDYQPKEAETLTEPGCPEEIDITCIKMQDIEVGEIINPYWVDRISENLMEMKH